MKELFIAPLTLFASFRTIKSNVKCVEKLEPLSLDQYLELPEAVGLTQKQRRFVYGLYKNKYVEWLDTNNFWDEADRILYILRWGNKVFSQPTFCSWKRHFNLGQGHGVADELGTPLYPFFDNIFVDEAQVSYQHLQHSTFSILQRPQPSFHIVGLF